MQLVAIYDSYCPLNIGSVLFHLASSAYVFHNHMELHPPRE